MTVFVTAESIEKAKEGPNPPKRSSKYRRARALLATGPALLLVLIAVVGPLFVPFDPTRVVATPDRPPGGDYLFGTDASGMDVFSRVIAGAPNNLVMAVLATVIATVGGVLLGLLIGANESRRGPIGVVARGVARGLDVFQALPGIIVGLVLLAFLGSSLPALATVIAIIVLPAQARLVRVEVLRVRTESYLDAARISGESEFALTLRHILPNSCWPALENASLIFGAAITVGAAFGFLGVGLQPPTPEWGVMIASGTSSALSGRWWAALFPALALALTVVVISLTSARFLQRRF
jgi:peptide/nickel transport system permease protein